MVVQPNRDRQAERREATRREILAAAWDVAAVQGIGGLTLREVAARVGMRPPSLYSHVASKNDLYDAMFEQAWRDFGDVCAEAARRVPSEPRDRLLHIGRTFFAFAMEDVARYQLMNLRVLPDFTPSEQAYQGSLDVMALLVRQLGEIGITRAEDVDLYTALLAGLVAQQQANDPGGDRWGRLLSRTTEMCADALGLPPRPARTRTRRSR